MRGFLPLGRLKGKFQPEENRSGLLYPICPEKHVEIRGAKIPALDPDPESDFKLFVDSGSGSRCSKEMN